MRLIRADGHQVGVVPFTQAMQEATVAGLDLVLVSPREVIPPVCKLVNFGQLKYEQKKRDKKAKRQSKIMAVVKELKLSVNISIHDFQVRVSQCKRFLGKGYKVRVVVQFRGREATHADLGVDRLNKLAEAVVDCGHVESPPRSAGLLLSMMMSPNKGGVARSATPHPL